MEEMCTSGKDMQHAVISATNYKLLFRNSLTAPLAPYQPMCARGELTILHMSGSFTTTLFGTMYTHIDPLFFCFSGKTVNETELRNF